MPTEELDLTRALAIALIAFNAGVAFDFLVRTVDRFRVEHSKLWLARAWARVAFLGLLFFCLDAMLEHWGEPTRARVYVLAVVLLTAPWAHTVLAREVLRRPGATRRATDPPSP